MLPRPPWGPLRRGSSGHDVLKVHATGLVADRVDVGDVVADYVHHGLVAMQTEIAANIERSIRKPPEACWRPRLTARRGMASAARSASSERSGYYLARSADSSHSCGMALAVCLAANAPEWRTAASQCLWRFALRQTRRSGDELRNNDGIDLGEDTLLALVRLHGRYDCVAGCMDDIRVPVEHHQGLPATASLTQVSIALLRRSIWSPRMGI